MEETKKARRQAGTGTADARGGEGEKPATPHAHLIRIADEDARRRAIAILGETREPYSGFTDYRLLVTNEQLEVLRREAIPFELLS